jgi:hypothetical protein
MIHGFSVISILRPKQLKLKKAVGTADEQG